MDPLKTLDTNLILIRSGAEAPHIRSKQIIHSVLASLEKRQGVLICISLIFTVHAFFADAKPRLSSIDNFHFEDE